MTREGIRLTAAIVAAVLAAALLTACGGSDSSSTNASTSEEAASAESGSSGQEGGTQADQGSGESKPVDVATPLRISGGGSEQFRFKGGDNSIQEYGEEGDESELQEGAEAVHGFFVARAERDWKAACSYLSKSMVEQLEQLAASSTQLADKRCPAFLEAFTSRVSPTVARESTVVDAGSLRREDEQAFLIYYGADKVVFAMPLYEEDDEFKVGALAGNPLG